MSDKKKGFQPPPSGTSAGAPTGSTPSSTSSSGSSRAAARRSGQSTVRVSPEPASPIEKYRFPIIIGLLIAGLIAIALVFMQSASAAPYTCTTQMTPGPIETDPVGAAPVATTVPASAAPATSAAPAASAAPDASATPAPTPTPAATPWLGFVAQDLGQGHVSESTSVTYAYCPPTSGQHFSSANAPLPRRFYGPTDTVRPGNWIHNLEHGYVTLLYKGEPDAATLAELRRIMDETPGTQYTQETCGAFNKVIVARFDDMTTPYAAVSWDRAMLLEEFDAQKLQTFAEQWQESPVWPEKGVC